jgi:hypothetical protein
LGSVRCRRSNAEDGAFDRPANRRVAGPRRGREAAGDLIAGEVEVVTELGYEGPDELRQDDTAVALGAGQQPVGECLHQRREVGVRPLGRNRFGAGDERQVGVGAGVAVGHREHVERVDLGAGLRQTFDAQIHPRAKRVWT